MPTFHESDEEWIYTAICDNTFTFDPETKVYKYKNPKYPNKNYKKIFDPKLFMSRGDSV